jgi:hypothetical protein
MAAAPVSKAVNGYDSTFPRMKADMPSFGGKFETILQDLLT